MSLSTPDSNRVFRLSLLALLVAAGAWLRLVSLGEISLRGDTLHFWNICREPGMTAWNILGQWKARAIDHPALPLMLTRWLIDVLHLPVTFFTIRLPSALMGIATIGVAYGIGRRLLGAWGGLLAALLLAFSPFHIQMSSEAYFYSAMILGSFMIFLSLLDVVRTIEHPAPLGRAWHLAFAGGFLLVIHSQFTGWSSAYLYAACMLAVLFWRMQRRGEDAARRDLLILLAVLALHTVALLLSPWGPLYVIAKIWSPMKGVYAAVAESSGENAGTMLFRTTTTFGWGWTPARAVFTFAVLGLGAAFMARDRASRPTHVMAAAVLLLAWLIFFVSRKATASLYEVRYVSGLMPAYLYVLLFGLLRAGAGLLPERLLPWARGALVAAGFALLAGPAWLCTQLTGQPAPYGDAVRWADRTLTPGAPVLVDRWFEPWNELAAHPATNVVFTFTVPNEPLDTFLRGQWRLTARQFFERHPDAAYLEVAKTYWDAPTVGPWTWPREYFARHVAISNVAGMKLRGLGLAARGDYYGALTNRVILEYYYNTREDVLAKAKAEGRPVAFWYGAGWRYEKTGPMGLFRIQTQEFRDWRALDREAELELYNLTEAPLEVELRLTAVALGGAKRVQMQGQQHDFRENQLGEWRPAPLRLEPGLNRIAFRDPLAGGGPPRLLLLGSLQITPR